MFSTSLQRALRKGMAPNGDLAEQIRSLENYRIHSRKDAKAIVEVLKRFPSDRLPKNGLTSPLRALLSLFQDVEGPEAPAFEVLREEGTIELARIYDQVNGNLDEDLADDLLFVLKILAVYGTHQGAQKVLEALKLPLEPDSWMWSVILSAYSGHHPEREFVFTSLAQELPPGFAAVALLDAANEAAIENRLGHHPFDTVEGTRRLRGYLTDASRERWTYAHSAAASLPFLQQPVRDELLALAREHFHRNVRIEGAWASAKVGQKIGLDMLAGCCLDTNHFTVAALYLKDLGREDIIPNAALDQDFQAKAELANWLAHPNELNRPPDDLEIIDKRTLFWPPASRTLSLWLVRYVARDMTGLEADEVGCGLVGSMTFCLFSYKMLQRSPEDCYALHCCLELRIEAIDVDDPSDYSDMLKAWPGPPLENAVVTYAAEIPHALRQGRGLVAMAVAEQQGEPGWAVLDGNDSAWYPKADMPSDVLETTVLKVHIGRRLLGFTEQADRKRYLGNVPVAPSAASICPAYEKLLEESRVASHSRKRELLTVWGNPLGRHLLRYSIACEALGRESQAHAFVRGFEKILGTVREMPEPEARQALGVSGAIYNNLRPYVDALLAIGRQADILPMIETLEAHLEPREFGPLGAAAYLAGDPGRAERLLLQLQKSEANWRESKEMPLLARIWHQQGKVRRAKYFLLECMIALANEASRSSSAQRRYLSEPYEGIRQTYAELFPAEVDCLKNEGLPDRIR